MPLKLMVTKGDKILVGDDCIVEVLSLGKRTTLQFAAPPDVKILQIHNDPEDQWKNRRKAFAEGNRDEA